MGLKDDIFLTISYSVGDKTKNQIPSSERLAGSIQANPGPEPGEDPENS